MISIDLSFYNSRRTTFVGRVRKRNNVDSKQNKNKPTELTVALSALGAVGLSIFAYHQLKSLPAKLDFREDLQEYKRANKDYVDYIKKRFQNLTVNERKFYQEKSDKTKDADEILNNIISKEELEALNYAFFTKDNIKAFPQIIKFENANDNTAKILTHYFGERFGLEMDFRTYERSYLKDFMNLIFEQSKQKQNFEPNLIYIKNLDKMYNDIDSAPRSDRKYYRKVLTYINMRNTVFITNNPINTKTFALKFKPEINDCADKIAVGTFKRFDKIPSADEFTLKILRLEDKKTGICGFVNYCKGFEKYKESTPLIFAKNLTDTEYKTIISEINAFQKSELEFVDIGSKNKNAFEKLKQEMQYAKKISDITGVKKYLVIKNADKILNENPEKQKIINLINNADKEYGVKIILDYEYDMVLLENFEKEKFSKIIGTKFASENEVESETFANIAETSSDTYRLGVNVNSQMQKEQDYVEDHFLDFLDAERVGKPVPIENGILIYGKESDSLRFLNWLKLRSNLNYEEVEVDVNNPKKSYKEIVEIMEKAKEIKKNGGERTLIYVKNIDEILTIHDTMENSINIGKFKNIVEQASKHYQTTIVITTEKDLSTFEEASIAPHRFGIKVDLSEKNDSCKLIPKIQKEQDYVEEHFLDFLDAERVGKPVPIENGILIYGKESDSLRFLNWLKLRSNLNYEEVEVDVNNPIKSYKEIVEIMEKAKEIKKNGGERTLIYVKNIDEILTKFDTPEHRRMIGGFKNIVEQASKYYQTTIVITTEKDLSTFEEASIAPHRFGIKVDLSEI